jgi:hypothetical protein
MPEYPLKGIRSKLEEAPSRFVADIEQLQQELAEIIAKKRLSIELDDKLEADLGAARNPAEVGMDRVLRAYGKARRRRRGPPEDGGELAPVKPKPKPTPLVDGAEAPLD